MFTVFGSESSLDLDVMVFVDEIPEDNKTATDICKVYNESIALVYEKEYGITKEVNCNLAVLKNGQIKQVYKGTSDEVNNSIFLTKDFHTQFHSMEYVIGMVERDHQIKLLRTARVLLSFLSRTSHRLKVKAALRGDVYHKIKVLREIDLGEITDIGKSSTSFEDYLKTMAFQLGQSIGLMEGVELYAKESIGEAYPLLETFLNRDVSSELSVLNGFKEEFCDICDNFEFTDSYEYKV